MPNPFLKKHSKFRNKTVPNFSKEISPKVKIIAWLEFAIAYYDVTFVSKWRNYLQKIYLVIVLLYRKIHLL